jgi:hypothetical protein
MRTGILEDAMKRMLPVVLMSLLAAPGAFAAEAPGAAVPPPAAVDGKSLPLDAMCVRRKFVVDNCLGTLYTQKPASTPEELFLEPGDKLLRLDILRDKVEKERVMGAFEEGFIRHSPDFATSPDAKRFLSLFRVDFYKGDRVDLLLGGDGTVAASRNGQSLGTITSTPLVRGILKTWFGRKAADGNPEPQLPGNPQPQAE